MEKNGGRAFKGFLIAVVVAVFSATVVVSLLRPQVGRYSLVVYEARANRFTGQQAGPAAVIFDTATGAKISSAPDTNWQAFQKYWKATWSND